MRQWTLFRLVARRLYSRVEDCGKEGKRSKGLSNRDYITLLKKCGELKSLDQGVRLHSHIVSSGCLNVYHQNLLIEMYGKCGDMERAKEVFSAIPKKNTFSFNMLISAAARNGLHRDALELFEQMEGDGVCPDKFTYADAFSSCCSLRDLAKGREIHAKLVASRINSDEFLQVALLNMYAKIGALDEAFRLFEVMHEPVSVIPWNVMIAAFSQNGLAAPAVGYYRRLLYNGVRPDLCTLISVLSAVSSLRLLSEGRNIHELISTYGYGVDDTVLQTALLDMYGKCGSVEEAEILFDRIPKRDIVTWNAMIAAYAQNGYGSRALKLYREMEPQGFKPELVTFVNLLAACCNMGALAEGRKLHARLVEEKYELNLVAENAILNMYAKCGSLTQAKAVFDRMKLRDVVSWNALIAANAENCNGATALQLCLDMAQDGVGADGTTFTCIFLCCSHGGMVESGISYFRSMVSDYQIPPSCLHYQSMVDLLGRAGWLKEAEELINVMPYQVDMAGWRAYLGAWRTQVIFR